MVNDLLAQGGISLPIQTGDLDFPIVQYADDTLLILPADLDHVLALKEVLHKFSLSTCLRVNYQKSSMVPANVDEQTLNILPIAFGCHIVFLPFTYSGLPLGTTKPKI
jgi:hypothetical protein